MGQLLLLLSIGAVANRQLRWFSSWSDLVGASSRLSVPGTAHARLDQELAQLSARRQSGRGAILDWVLTGQSSKISQRAKVYLPADYFTAAGEKAKFPVIELLAGFPGGPDTWIHPLRIGPILDTEIAAGRMAPTIVVMPVQNVSAWQDSECVNAQHGPQMDTYLCSDLQSAVARDFRTAPPGPGWGLIGYSTGGFCAVNLALRHPNEYGAAASLSGYFVPLTDATTGNLYGRSTAARQANSPLWRMQHDADPDGRAPYFYLVASSGDPADVAAIAQFRRAIPVTRSATVAILHTGGHNFRVWRFFEPAALDWTSLHLSPPLAPALVAP
jgi:S-formylglutathione hydrolase FrmB